MNRKTFLLGLSNAPLLVGSLSLRAATTGEKAPDAVPSAPPPPDPQAITKDVFAGQFPPRSYGSSPEEAEPKVMEVVEQVFRDEDGLLRSGVNAVTMEPIRIEEIKDRPLGFGTFAQNSSVPQEAKPVWMTYENAGQASGTYLDAMCAKAKLTGDSKAHEVARRTVQGIRSLWENAAHNKHPLGGEGRGWFPKPYLGVQKVLQMYECSADQYCDVTLGLHSYYYTLASQEEKRQIQEIVVSFADWWHDHDYCGVYFGQAIWWKRLPTHPMAVGYFLFLNAWANALQPSAKFEDGFATWFKLKPVLQTPAKPIWLCMHGIALNLAERLIVVKPEHTDVWRACAAYQAPLLLDSVNGKAGDVENIDGIGANYLATAHRLLPTAGYDKRSRQCLEASLRRDHFYAIKRGKKLVDLDRRLVGDDYRDQYWCENHVHWLAGYWRNRTQV